MNIQDLTAKIVAAHTEALGKVPEGKVRLIVRETLHQIREAVESTEEGALNIETLGQFKIRLAEVERDGQKVSVRRAAFHAGKKPPKSEKTAAPATADE
jgi:nucleoid DNA-binding protein